jgi:hypothetical protein
MKTLVEKGFNSIVYALLFITIAFVLDTLAPREPIEIYKLYGSYVQSLWFIAILFTVISSVLVIIAIGLKLGLFVGVGEIISNHHIALGFAINGLGFLSVMFFLSQYVVFPW